MQITGSKISSKNVKDRIKFLRNKFELISSKGINIGIESLNKLEIQLIQEEEERKLEGRRGSWVLG